MIIAANTKKVFEKHGDALLAHATPKQLLDAVLKQNPEFVFEQVAEKYRDKVVDMVIGEQRKPLGFDQLAFRFIDTNGVKYYGYHKDMPLPIERFGKMRDFLMWMTVGVSPDELKAIIDAAEKSWVDTLKSKKNHQRVGVILGELELRMKMVIHTDLLYNFLAVQWVREDENPELFDATIHNEKVEQFKKETQSGNSYFFFHQPELLTLNELWNFTESEWQQYWNESIQQQQRLKIALKTVLSDIE